MDWIIGHWVELVGIVTGAIALASAIAALTPTPRDDRFLAKLRKLVDLVALNVGHAKGPDKPA